jgi:hypothetical protein
MTTYMVGYDLNSPGGDYSGLVAHLKTYPKWWHRLDSTWLISTTATAVQIRDSCKAYLDSNDEILVAVVSAPAAWAGFDSSQWLHDNL